MDKSIIDKLWKRVDGLFDLVDGLIDGALYSDAKYGYDGKPDSATKKHRVTSSGGHIVITGEYQSLTINGKRVRLQGEKK